MSFDTNCIGLEKVPLAQNADILKVSDKYKSEEVRFMTIELKTIKVWTYEFKDFELFLDTRLEQKAAVRSVAICEESGVFAVVSADATTSVYTFRGEFINSIKNEEYSAVCCSGNHLIFGTDKGELSTFDMRFMQ